MRIVMIGAGNLAIHLSKALQDAGNDLIQVFSRSEKSAAWLAGVLKTDYTTAIHNVRPNAELYIIAITDDAIPEIVSCLPFTERLVVHTAGSIPRDVFAGKMRNYGIFYPLQSFSKACPVDFAGIPVFLEANTPENLQTLQSLAEQISSNVSELSSEKRLLLHLAAVFGSNFANSLYEIAAQITEKAGLTFDVLSPLLSETLRKATNAHHPASVQTGPAKRNDRRVLQEHIDLLTAHPEWRQLYVQMSECIRQQHEQAKP
jgi:predicted short-subunit dehydrogenase-like oxidoreductase (DUF2520 family)